MRVRGAPLIGATAAYGLALALNSDGSDAALESARGMLAATRPTAINLRWALDEVAGELRSARAEGRLVLRDAGGDTLVRFTAIERIDD